MRIRLPIAVLALFFLFWTGACSRPPKVTQSPAKSAADVTLRLANSLEKKQRILDSKQSYESALAQYRSFGDVTGEMYALAGLARLARQKGDLEGYNAHHQRMVYLAEYAGGGNEHILLLLDLYRYQQDRDYARILAMAQDSYDHSISSRIQILTYRLQAESYLQPERGSSSYDDLLRLATRYRRSLKKQFTADPTVLSAALYALAYHKYLQKDYSTAIQHIDEVVELDTFYENFSGLGYAHWLRGTIHEANKDRRQAIMDYIRAQNIFTQYQNPEMIRKTNESLIRLEGVEP